MFGIPPYANNLWDLIHKLTAELGAESYRRIYPFGTSMGGFAALRCGILLKTETAISCGGQFPPSPEFLMRNRKLNLASFDPLCACNAETTTKLICCHSTNYPADIKSVDMLQRIIPIERVPIEAPGHAFPETLWEQGRLRAFYDRMFDNEPVEAPADKRSSGRPRRLRPTTTASPFARQVVLGEALLQQDDLAVGLLDARP